RSERAARIPVGMPTSAQNSTEVTIIASVVMVCGHRPIMSMKAKPTTVKIAVARPAVSQLASAKAAVVTSIGTNRKNASVQASTALIGTCAARKAGRKFGTSQPRTNPFTQSSNGRVAMSAGLNMGGLLFHRGGFNRGGLGFGGAVAVGVAGKMGQHVIGVDHRHQPVGIVGHGD